MSDPTDDDATSDDTTSDDAASEAGDPARADAGAGPKRVRQDELTGEAGLELETEVVHELQVDSGFMFSG